MGIFPAHVVLDQGDPDLLGLQLHLHATVYAPDGNTDHPRGPVGGRAEGDMPVLDLVWGWAPAGAGASAGRYLPHRTSRRADPVHSRVVRLGRAVAVHGAGAVAQPAALPPPPRREPLYARRTPTRLTERHCGRRPRNRLATAGSSEAPACQGALPSSGSRWWGWRGWRALGLGIPTAVSRNCGPEASHSRVDIARSAKCWSPATPSTCVGRRQAPQPYPEVENRRALTTAPLRAALFLLVAAGGQPRQHADVLERGGVALGHRRWWRSPSAAGA